MPAGSTQIAPGEEVGDIPIDVPFAGAAGAYGAHNALEWVSRNDSFRQGLFDATSEPWLY